MRVLALVLVCGAAVAAEFRQPVVGDVVVTAYYDVGGNRDWNCGNHTYGGHRGTDLGIIGRFAAQDAGRDVVAAADGRVTRRHDGEFDRCTTGNCAGGGGFGNHVVLEHGDGKVSYYAHLRNGSVAVQEGQQVRCGDRLGQVGSSGFSTGPHLHFEVRVGGNADDPFRGNCGGPLSYWVDQGAYRALPVSRCEAGEPPPPPPPPPPPMLPDMHLSTTWAPPDFAPGGRSAGVGDAWLGEETAWRVVVHNRGNGTTAGETEDDAAATFAYELPAGFEAVRYVIEDDHPELDRATWGRNDAMENGANPPADAPPRAGRLRLNGFSAGESKRVTLWVRATERRAGGELRAWIAHLRDYYGEKDGWDDPAETNRGQTFNGGDLKVGARADAFDKRRFFFDFGDEQLLEGWRACDGGAAWVDTEVAALVVATEDGAACVESPELALDVAGIRGVRVAVDHLGGAAEGRLAWDGGSSGFRTVGGGELEPLHVGVDWVGVLSRFRIHPADGVGEVRIHAIELVDEAPLPERDGGAPPPSGDGKVPPPQVGDDGVVVAAGDGGVGALRDGAAAGDGGKGETVRVEGGCRSVPGGGGGWWSLLLLFGVTSRSAGRIAAGRRRRIRGAPSRRRR